MAAHDRYYIIRSKIYSLTLIQNNTTKSKANNVRLNTYFQVELYVTHRLFHIFPNVGESGNNLWKPMLANVDQTLFVLLQYLHGLHGLQSSVNWKLKQSFNPLDQRRHLFLQIYNKCVEIGHVLVA